MVLVLRTRGSESSPIVLLVPRLISGSPAEKRFLIGATSLLQQELLPSCDGIGLQLLLARHHTSLQRGRGKKVARSDQAEADRSGLPTGHASAARTVARRASGAPHEGGAPLAEARRSAEEAPRAPSLIQHTHAIRVPGSHEDYRMRQPGSSTYSGRFRPRVRFMCVLGRFSRCGWQPWPCQEAAGMVYVPPGRYAERAAAGDRYRPCLTLRIVAMPAGGGSAVTTSTSVRRKS